MVSHFNWLVNELAMYIAVDSLFVSSLVAITLWTQPPPLHFPSFFPHQIMGNPQHMVSPTLSPGHFPIPSHCWSCCMWSYLASKLIFPPRWRWKICRHGSSAEVFFPWGKRRSCADTRLFWKDHVSTGQKSKLVVVGCGGKGSTWFGDVWWTRMTRTV